MPALAFGQESRPLLVEGAAVPEGAVAVVDGDPIPFSELADEIRVRFRRRNPGPAALETLIDEQLVESEMRRRGIAVTAADVQARRDSLDAELRKKGLKPLAEYLKENEVDAAAFEEKLRKEIALTRLARADLGRAEGDPIEPHHQQLWLANRKKEARIETDAAELPAGAVAVVDDVPITSERFAREILKVLDRRDLRKEIETLLQLRVVSRLLAENHLALTEADVNRTFEAKKARFETEANLKYEDIIVEQTGMDLADFRNGRGFRIHAALDVLANRVSTDETLTAFYREHLGYFGPRTRIAHVLLRAAETPGEDGASRTFEEAEKLAARILDELRGGRNFADIVRLYSDDPGTRFKEGDLGFVTPLGSRLPKNLRDAVQPLDVGGTSAPVRSPRGIHILRVTERQPPPPMEDVRGELRTMVVQKVFREAYDKARIGIDVRL